MNQFITFFATGFYAGKIPFAPGTWGTLAAIPLFMVLSSLSPLHYSVTITAFIFFSAWVSGRAQDLLGKKDPSCVVIDEIAGYFVTMAFHAPTIHTLILGFVLFRVLDIFKPFPCRWLDQNLHSGWGIVLDDVMAGVYANLCLSAMALVFLL